MAILRSADGKFYDVPDDELENLGLLSVNRSAPLFRDVQFVRSLCSPRSSGAAIRTRH